MDDNLQRLDTEVTMALAGLDIRTTQMAPRDRPGKWNIQQIAEHLLLAIEGTGLAVREQMKKGALESRPGLGQRVGRWLILSRGWFPAGRKSPEAAIPNRPVTLKTGDQLADRLHGALTAFDSLGVEARKRIGEGAIATHGALGALSMAQWSRFHLVHGRHHLKQIARIRRENGL